jgi:6-pyruvoyltetrahydropterin/6-carboxytetrahydropterin synthase
MYYLEKRLEIAGAHYLQLNYESKCSNLHGHNWQVTIYCKSEELDENGMVVDFTKIKEQAMKLDHKNLNEVLAFNPTAENIAEYLCTNIPKCYKVDVIESENNKASYVLD